MKKLWPYIVVGLVVGFIVVSSIIKNHETRAGAGCFIKTAYLVCRTKDAGVLPLEGMK